MTSFKFLGKQPPKQEWGAGNYWSERSKFFEGALREAANEISVLMEEAEIADMSISHKEVGVILKKMRVSLGEAKKE